MAASATAPLLEVRDLKVSFNTEDGVVRAVDGVSFTLMPGEVLGILGESGSGKSVRMMSVLRLINDPNVVFEGQVLYKGRDVMALPEDRMREVRGGDIVMIVILITHDLGIVAGIADRIAVMYAGRIVEFGRKRELFYDPQHPYTWGLLGSIPRLDRPKAERLHSIAGMPPSLIDPSRGCRFRPRCLHAFDRCVEEPGLEVRAGAPGHEDRCRLDGTSKRALRDRTIHAEAEAA